MANLREAAQKKSGGALRQKVKSRGPAQLNHPTMDSAESAARPTYIPPQPESRFKFLKTFATIPGLRSKGTPQPQ